MTIKDQLEEEFLKCGDDFSKMITTLSEEELNYKLNNSWGNNVEDSPFPFTAWGEIYVYFPLCYDSTGWIGVAPRNPCEIKMNPQGGG